jgi:hypothetical protein
VLHVLADHLHVELHGVAVRMHLDDGDLVALGLVFVREEFSALQAKTIGEAGMSNA